VEVVYIKASPFSSKNWKKLSRKPGFVGTSFRGSAAAIIHSPATGKKTLD
jgi:hypothetical protein